MEEWVRFEIECAFERAWLKLPTEVDVFKEIVKSTLKENRVCNDVEFVYEHAAVLEDKELSDDEILDMVEILKEKDIDIENIEYDVNTNTTSIELLNAILKRLDVINVLKCDDKYFIVNAIAEIHEINKLAVINDYSLFNVKQLK